MVRKAWIVEGLEDFESTLFDFTEDSFLRKRPTIDFPVVGVTVIFPVH